MQILINLSTRSYWIPPPTLTNLSSELSGSTRPVADAQPDSSRVAGTKVGCRSVAG
ncbi:hypothetical protein [uncultured Deefgea sp.]|uniref:hypothetical protein n=1 Tax=uncultured Deefgea sp. TaxID=1304914 RepID=UPI00262F3615|nr:hypothetical protein [uncultured Deefgea sp.]